ncbi:GNAT family N-acetyltransferase [Streptomyces sp. NPDC048825]|uniref:GNAT family N-acetyltransferase n=1 Tax=Streptomyces sp. NPDC048825 TaxID=3365592 RepID=UPI003713121F
MAEPRKTNTDMKIKVLAPTELRPNEMDAWHSIQADHPEYANPFLGPGFAQAVSAVRPTVRVAVAMQGSDPVAFLPFERGPLGIGRAVGLGVSDCQAVVQRPGAVSEAEPLLRACGLSVWEFDNLVGSAQPFSSYARTLHASPVMDVSDGYERYKERVSEHAPRFVRTMGKYTRRLTRDFGNVRFVFDETDQDQLRTLMRWKSAQYRRTGRKDRFAQPWITELLTRLQATRMGQLTGLLSVLYSGDQPVAAHFGLRSERVLACWFPAYDTRFYRYSPGLMLHLRMAEEAAAAGLDYMDLGRGASEHKETLKTRELTVAEGWAALPSAGAVAHWLSRAPAERLCDAVLERPHLRRAARRTLNGLGMIRTRWAGHSE